MTSDDVAIVKDGFEKLKSLLVENKYKNIFLVRGNASFVESQIGMDIGSLNNGYDIVDFHGYDHNPSAEDVAKGLSLAQGKEIDLVLAVGGGSAIDIAKSIRSAMSIGHAGVVQAAVESIRQEVSEDLIPLAVLPTTSGTGSEVTSFAVLYVDGIKYSLAGPAITPNYAIVDPELTHSLPPSVTAEVGLDALCQGIESLWSVKSTEESSGYALRAIKAAVENLAIAVNAPSPEAREAMCIASHNAGKAINITTTTAAHAVSYPLTIHFGIAHGHAVALTLAEFAAVNDPNHATFDSRISNSIDKEEYSARITELHAAFGANSADEFTSKFYDLVSSLGLEIQLSALGITEESFDLIMAEVNPLRLGNNPTNVSKEMIHDCLKQQALKRVR